MIIAFRGLQTSRTFVSSSSGQSDISRFNSSHIVPLPSLVTPTPGTRHPGQARWEHFNEATKPRIIVYDIRQIGARNNKYGAFFLQVPKLFGWSR